jgi:hypothetical protein
MGYAEPRGRAPNAAAFSLQRLLDKPVLLQIDRV